MTEEWERCTHCSKPILRMRELGRYVHLKNLLIYCSPTLNTVATPRS